MARAPASRVPQHLPTNLEELARHCTREGIELACLRQVQTLGETLAPRVRAACAEAWGVGVADMYSTEEIGYIALQCPEHERYHVQAENAYVEILDDADRPCAPGEVGRVVVTALHNLATPLIRYDLGDYAEAGGACDCGRGLPVLERIMGRTRNMLTLPTGERFWPSLGDAGYTEAAPISQFQLVQTALERIEVRLVAQRHLEAGEEAALTKLIHQRLGYAFDLEFSYHREIARSEGGKYEDFKSEIESSG